MEISVKKAYSAPSCDIITFTIEQFCASGKAYSPQIEDFDISDGEW